MRVRLLSAVGMVVSVIWFAVVLPVVAQEQVTIVVDTSSNVVDFGGARQVRDLPGPDGTTSLREATIASSNTAGPETIAFNIPTSDPGFTGSSFVIGVDPSSSQDQLTLNDDQTTIDGTTQPGGFPIVVQGTTQAVMSRMAGMVVNSSNNRVTGLTFVLYATGIQVNGNGNHITACRASNNIDGMTVTGGGNTIGGTPSGDGNVLSNNGGVGLRIQGPGATANVVQGNRIGTTVDGTGALRNHSGGVLVTGGASGNTIGGTASGARNVISGNGHFSGEFTRVGFQLSIRGTSNNVQGNYIGVNATGTSGLAGAASTGVRVSGGPHVVGGTSPGAANVISAHPTGIGILAAQSFPTTDIMVQGNLIGTDATGIMALPNSVGIAVDRSSALVVGGTGPGEANLIVPGSRAGVEIFAGSAVDVIGNSIRGGSGHGVVVADGTRVRIVHNIIRGNGGDGVLIVGGTGVTVSRGSIFDNGGLGIDLGSNDGVTPNDPGDGDTGPNGLQNFPIIQSARRIGTGTAVRGQIDTPNPQTVTIELFSNDAPDPSGFGEGQVFHATVTPDAQGEFMAILRAGLAGKYITATATNAAESTSEFSEARLVR